MKKLPRAATLLKSALFLTLSLSHGILSAHAFDPPGAKPLNPACVNLLGSPLEWIKLVEGDPVLLARAKHLSDLFQSGKATPGQYEMESALLLQDLRDRSLLKPVLAKALAEAKKKPGFPAIPGSDAEIIDQLYGMIDGQLISMGLSPKGLKAAFKPWLDLAATQMKSVLESGRAKISELGFVKEFAKLTRARLSSKNSIRILNDAKEALSERLRLVGEAKKSIHIMTWAMYGDEIGNQFADLLIKRHQEGIDVRVIVDAQTSQKVGYRESIQKLQAAGVPVVQWRSDVNPYYGQHRKCMTIDGADATGTSIAGGRNIGDVYLHTGKPGTPKWRDTDILYQGKSVQTDEEFFTEVWNSQSPEAPMPKFVKSNRTGGKLGKTLMGIIDHIPNPEGYDPIYLGILKGIESAEHSIDIANAYFITTPALKEAIIRARARGVRVRIFTNSATSVDEPIVSVPILKSVAELLPYGVEVFLKTGDTLHSKFIIFDDKVTGVLSYNLHPRSLRYECETARFMFDPEVAREMKADFEADLAAAQAIKKVEELGIPKSKISDLAERIGRDML